MGDYTRPDPGDPGTIKTFSFKIVIIMRRFYLLEPTNYPEHLIQLKNSSNKKKYGNQNHVLSLSVHFISCPHHYKPQSNFRNYCWCHFMKLMLSRARTSTSCCVWVCGFENTHPKMRKQIHNNHQIQIKGFPFSTRCSLSNRVRRFFCKMFVCTHISCRSL